jgi:RNase H-fold protein (predicted Holliday junction resolvase)
MPTTPVQGSVAPTGVARVLAIDPGRDKCGIAVGELKDGQVMVIARCIIRPQEVAATATRLMAQYKIEIIVLGDSTTSQLMAETLRMALPDTSLVSVSETGSTLEARALYWEAHPPRGWRKVVPLTLQEPPEPVDDFAAVVLARRYFGQG